MGIFDKLKNSLSSLVNLDDEQLYDDANNYPDEVVVDQYAQENKKLSKKGQKDKGNMAIPTFIKNNNPSPFQQGLQGNMQSPFGGQMPNMQQGYMQNAFQGQVFPNNGFAQQENPYVNQNQFGQQPAFMQQNQHMQMPQFANQQNVIQNQTPFVQQLQNVQQQNQTASPFMQSLESTRQNQMPKAPSLNNPAFTTQKSDNIKKFDPQSFEEVQEIAVLIKNGGTAIVNLEGVTYELSMRIIDFLTGLMFAYDGNMKEVQDNVYIASYTQSLDQGFKPMEDTSNKNNQNFTKMYQGGNPFSI